MHPDRAGAGGCEGAARSERGARCCTSGSSRSWRSRDRRARRCDPVGLRRDARRADDGRRRDRAVEASPMTDFPPCGLLALLLAISLAMIRFLRSAVTATLKEDVMTTLFWLAGICRRRCSSTCSSRCSSRRSCNDGDRADAPVRGRARRARRPARRVHGARLHGQGDARAADPRPDRAAALPAVRRQARRGDELEAATRSRCCCSTSSASCSSTCCSGCRASLPGNPQRSAGRRSARRVQHRDQLRARTRTGRPTAARRR